MVDRHDPRQFRHYAKVNDDGGIVGMVELVEGFPNPDPDHLIDVTDLTPYTDDEIAAYVHGRQQKT